MFYSQFILAKKGPLGTIWIAAHLERKLRKNQVADTDIGVSVDSILCPEVPIALRLSSHLLLGVVRIYSRKVNYLFHDCSEALLKIRQAFRSTAVDLPPEESTAPYHSITLPETFHLDDFELPDSVFQGDFVDHHVSTKEQITLQDTIDGATFSTVQFGLDERFGDDNASHIGLDLDEELFLSKHSSVQHSSIVLEVNDRSGNQGQSSSAVHVTEMDIDGNQNGSVRNTDVEAPEDLFNPTNDSVSAIEETKKDNLSSIWQGYNIQTPDLNEVFFPNEGTHTATSPSGIASIANDVLSLDPADCAHAPQTPGLVEEAVPPNIHESPALSPQRKLSPSLGEEAVKPENCSALSEYPDSMTANGLLPVVTMDEQQTEQLTVPDETQMECRQKNIDVDDKLICTEMSVLPVDHQDHVEGEVLLLEKTQMEGMVHDAPNNSVSLDESLGNAEKTLKTSNSSYTSSGVETNTSNAVTSVQTSNFHLRPCRANANLGNEPFAENGTSVQNASEGSTKDLGVLSEVLITETLDGGENLTEVQGKGSCMEIAADSRMCESGYTLTTDVTLVDILQKDIQQDQLNCSSISEFLEPEKMLLAPGSVDLVNELSQVTAEKKDTELDESNRISSLSGKKRRLLESSSVLDIDSSVKLAGRPRGRRSSEHIPDDDDLLSSILGAKRTPLLRVGPTPIKSTALKRQKLISSLGMKKRKVLVDDTTVLHADAIRQQLINTEDIRRVRKKAPCTRPEIWMIQKSYLEDEVFDEPVFTGISDELNALHNRKYDTEFIVVVNDSEKPELASDMPASVDGETQGLCGAPISSEALNDKGTGECVHAEIMLDDISHIAAPFAETSDNQQQMVNGLDLTNDELSEIKDSSTLHFTENTSEEFPATTSKSEGIDASLILDGPPQVSPVVPSSNDVLLSSIENNLHEDETPMLTDVSTFFPNTNSPLGDAIESGDATDLAAASGPKVIDGEVALDTEVLMEHAEHKCYDGENPISGLIDTEEPEMISISLSEQNPENGRIPLAIGETSGLQEFNLDGGVVVETTVMDSATAKETNDFCSTIDGNDTEFLNVDDEAEYEEAVDDMPSNENAKSLENSGWSSRTRGVARYLKILFDEETGHARKTVAMDHLIAGKSRKEASRMFFETLVLKTKDFIQVEQENPFGYINIKPRGKLLKSEF